MKQRLFRVFPGVALTAVMAIPVFGQAQVPDHPAAPQRPSVPVRKARTVRRTVAPVVIDTTSSAPQVVTILHRLNGLKMFRLLLRSGEGIGAITRLDDAFKIKDDVHTSVIAGLAMDDGETIAARLPQADAELGPAMAPPTPPSAPSSFAPPSAPGVKASTPTGTGLFGAAGNLVDRPDLTVIGRDGKRLLARYVGLDGVTGLSVLKLSGDTPLVASGTKDRNVAVGERIRLLGPEPVEQAEAKGTIHVRIGETEAKVIGVSRAPSGTLARIRIRSAKLTPANLGGIAINDAGETVGIVEAVEKNEATLLPNVLVRSAAKRVLDKQASVPRPWLGIRGEPLGTFPLEQMVRGGWQAEKAKSLVQDHRGIFLTSVAPGSPAAVAALRAGDVILRVNEGEVKTADDFSWVLEEVGAGNPVNFTVARPGQVINEAVEVTLSSAPLAFVGTTEEGVEREVNIERIIKSPAFSGAATSLTVMLMSQGVETIAVKPPVSLRFGVGSGLLVIYVNPQTIAFKAGLRSGDVIEAINGRSVVADAIAPSLDADGNYSLNVVRNKEKIVLKVASRQ